MNEPVKTSTESSAKQEIIEEHKASSVPFPSDREYLRTIKSICYTFVKKPAKKGNQSKKICNDGLLCDNIFLPDYIPHIC